jgi:hypothetical protein
VDTVRFLRRQPADQAASDPAASGSAAQGSSTGSEEPAHTGVRHHTPGKGRPTPKRRDAETRRRGPAPPPPKTQREAMKLAKQNRGSRAERRKEAADRRARMMAGDNSALMPRDRGPVKAFVRDAVDARRHVIGLFMPLAGLVFISLVLPIPQIQQMFSLFCIAMMASMVLEGVLLGRRITRQVRERFPKEEIVGFSIGWYAFTRASQLRKLRVPKPRVNIGDAV